MISFKKERLKPRLVRLDASTACQLKCPSCPTATGSTGRKLGVGFLKFQDFKNFIQRNPHVSHIELSNWGEVFLNKELVKILEYAYRHNVILEIANGANMNYIRADVLEAIVKYKLRRITCSIDGASQETYVQYRINGHFDKVIENIKMINHWKVQYRSRYPELKWQFVAFGHNEHEITKAREMAYALDMNFFLKLSWSELYGLPDFSPVKNKELVGKESGLGVASRKEFLEKYGQSYVERTCCWDLWNAPQINYDGRILGCPINYWGDYGNVFEKGLDDCLNGEKMNYARDMLMGKSGPRKDIPCSTCTVYHGIKKDQAWVKAQDLQEKTYRYGRRYIMLENKILGEEGAKRLIAFLNRVKRFPKLIKKSFREKRFDLNILLSLLPQAPGNAMALPNKGYPLSLPLPLDEQHPWKPYFLFDGFTKGIKDFAGHASALVSQHCPHPPHTHREEEILMMLSGEAELHLPLYQNTNGQAPLRLRPGEFVYYPPGFPHTLQTVSAQPANYLMLKWFTPNAEQVTNALSFEKYSVHDTLRAQEGTNGFNTQTLFDAPSRYLKRLHGHTSHLSPGAGYPPHADPYDVVIIVLEGEIETLGKLFGPHSVIFYPAGQRHGLINPGLVPAQYVVFEFQVK